MRKLLCLAAAIVVCSGCQPRVKVLNAQPSSVGLAPSSIKINWRLSAGTGDLSADQPVTPSLNPKKPVDQEGSLDFLICKTTTFKLEPHYGGERTVTVTVAQPCSCNQQTLTFTGTCDSALSGPNYGPQTVSANNIGILKTLISDADFPIQVEHLGAFIPMQAGGGPIGLVPAIPAAGEYKISVPGAVGLQICAGAPGPSGGRPFDAPVVHLTVVPECPKP